MRNFSARETEWLQELDGIELASFMQRAFAFVIDWTIITILFSILATVVASGYLLVRHIEGKPIPKLSQFIDGKDGDFNISLGPGSDLLAEHKKPETGTEEALHIITDIVVPVLYFGTLLWRGKGRTPGKRIMKIRVVSLMHRHLTFWHCVERALGYGAAALEGGFGFVQFFIHPYRRCAQDRLAETIVVTEKSYQALQHKLSHPLIPDDGLHPNAPEA